LEEIMRLFPIVGLTLALMLSSFAQETETAPAPAEDYGSVMIDDALQSTAETTATEIEPAPAVEADPSAPAPAEEPAAATPAAAPKIVIFLPEQIDAEWYWYFYSDVAQHIVQSALEKELIRAGFDVIDLASIKLLKDIGSIDQVTQPDFATQAAKQAGADYAIVGKATAVKASDSVAYGVKVIRSNAEITAKLIRVSDGKVIAVEDASAQQGGQAQRAAGQEALKKAAPAFSKKMVKAIKAQLPQ
jgi:hypothetical protein